MKPIPYAPDYLVTDDGRVFSQKTKSLRERKLVKDKDGYWRVGIMVDGKLKLVGVHRLVCETFNGPCPGDGMEVRHLDGNKTNNVPSNLQWGTRKENAEDMVRHGGHRASTSPDSYAAAASKHSEYKRAYWADHQDQIVRGSDHTWSKLKESDIGPIRARISAGETHASIAADYDVSRSAITVIASGKTWAHVK